MILIAVSFKNYKKYFLRDEASMHVIVSEYAKVKSAGKLRSVDELTPDELQADRSRPVQPEI
jgi:hypothetical protein